MGTVKGDAPFFVEFEELGTDFRSTLEEVESFRVQAAVLFHVGDSQGGF